MILINKVNIEQEEIFMEIRFCQFLVQNVFVKILLYFDQMNTEYV